jgi:hypothetical protein
MADQWTMYLTHSTGRLLNTQLRLSDRLGAKLIQEYAWTHIGQAS